MSFPDHFSAVAPDYAARRPGYPAPLADFLAETVALAETAWDAGCGSGQLALPLAGRFRRVIGTDASREQLARAGAHPRIRYACARAEASALADRSVDVATAAQAAHWFDLERYYAEVRRVVRPRGVIALVTYGNVIVDDDVDRLVSAFYRRDLASHWPAERRHVEYGYASLPFPFEELEPPPLEIRVEWTLEELLGYIRTWSAVRALERADGGAGMRRLTGDLGAAWGGEESRRVVRWPLSLRVGRL